MLTLLRLGLFGLLVLAVFLSAADRLLLAELAQHFRPQLALLALAGAGAALLLRRRTLAGAGLLVALLLAGPVLEATLPRDSAWPIAGATAAHDPGPAPVRLTLVAANLLHRNREPDRMVDALLAADADVLVLSEVIPSWEAVTARLRSRYPHRTPDHWWYDTSTVVWSRHPLRQGEAELRRLADRTVLDVTLEVGGRPLRLLGLHAPRPKDRQSMERRNRIFAQLDGWIGERATPTVLAGDFNATPWTPALHRAVEAGGLALARPDHGWYGSWPSPAGDLGIPIDQVLHGAGVTVEDFVVLDIPGSDHRAVKVGLALP